MQKDEAIMILSRHLMQCGMLMPIEWVQSNGDGSEFMHAFEMAMDALKNEPVRCKDCEHWSGNGYQKCRLHSTEPDQYGPGADICMKPDDFCSYGERKDNG